MRCIGKETPWMDADRGKVAWKSTLEMPCSKAEFPQSRQMANYIGEEQPTMCT